ncbi:HRDC domain-containing protein [Deinococcus yavapaiensis]|uniref:Cystathionine beta-lyase/cystathionine gamma-synthase n=1 Tax=Deinococcus yavapaiensis KR-236 TaxID=694435 RepID=A0A318SAW5_9DEIO|nr:HRDC domain-containing protein [Deinococcus yavapaiensis]PYE54250.1 cystathionine beta-lyase/cystathionine gamma-synthase [Deinococcus yavapaiensis KR-236]
MTYALETRLALATTALDTSRLPDLLAELEGADWALVFSGEAELWRALAEIVGNAVVRADARLPLDETALKAADFTTATLDADWKGSLVWLPETDERAMKRARRAEARVVVDATFCPGGGALASGATFVALRDAGALTGHGDVAFAALLGKGERPVVRARSIEPLAAALVLRDLPTLSARLARQTRGAHTLAERLGERATEVSGGTLLVSDDLADTTLFSEAAAIGGVRAARRAVAGGTLLSVGLEAVEDLWRDVTGDPVNESVKIVDEPATLELPERTDELDENTPEANSANAPVSVEITDEETDETESVGPDEPFDAPVAETNDELAEEQVEPIFPEPVDAPLLPDLPEVPTARGETTDPAEDLAPDQRAAYERLREWRNAEARRQEVSRFIVASNATLAEIARTLPQTEAELRAVRGMGPERVRKYAEPILNMLRGMR